MLTTKQELAIQYRSEGMSPTEAVLKAFNCKDKNVAGSLAYQLFKKPEVDKRLMEKQAMIDEKTTEMNVDFITLVKNNIKSQEVINKINELMKCGDKRTELSACDMYLKIIGGYKDKQSKSMDMFDSSDIQDQQDTKPQEKE